MLLRASLPTTWLDGVGFAVRKSLRESYMLHISAACMRGSARTTYVCGACLLSRLFGPVREQFASGCLARAVTRSDFVRRSKPCLHQRAAQLCYSLLMSGQPTQRAFASGRQRLLVARVPRTADWLAPPRAHRLSHGSACGGRASGVHEMPHWEAPTRRSSRRRRVATPAFGNLGARSCAARARSAQSLDTLRSLPSIEQ